MMLMMLAKGASIISIIGGPFLHFWPFTRNSLGALRLVFKTARAHDARVPGDSKNASKIHPCCGDSLLERVRILERSWNGVRQGSGRGPGRNGGPTPEKRSAASAPPRIEANL